MKFSTKPVTKSVIAALGVFLLMGCSKKEAEPSLSMMGGGNQKPEGGFSAGFKSGLWIDGVAYRIFSAEKNGQKICVGLGLKMNSSGQWVGNMPSLLKIDTTGDVHLWYLDSENVEADSVGRIDPDGKLNILGAWAEGIDVVKSIARVSVTSGKSMRIDSRLVRKNGEKQIQTVFKSLISESELGELRTLAASCLNSSVR